MYKRSWVGISDAHTLSQVRRASVRIPTSSDCSSVSFLPWVAYMNVHIEWVVFILFGILLMQVSCAS